MHSQFRRTGLPQAVFESDIYSIIYRTIERIGSELGALKVCPDADIDMMTHFYVVATAGLIESWLVGEIDKTPEEIIAFMDQVIQDHMRGAGLRFRSWQETRRPPLDFVTRWERR